MNIAGTLAKATAAAVAVSVLVAAPAVAATAFTVGGTTILGLGGGGEPWRLPIMVGYDEVGIDYPASPVGMDGSIGQGVDTLHGAIMGTQGERMVVGISQGALVIAHEKQRLLAMSPEERPARDELTFVAIGDPSNPRGLMRWLPGRLPVVGVTPVQAPETPYDTVYLTREYDGFADFPDYPLNLVSTANAIMGMVYVHARPDYASVDLSTVPEQNITETTNSLGGKTTSYFVPTAKLPLVQPLRDLGVDERFVSAIEEPLKRIVDAGYSRNDAQRAIGAADEAADERREAARDAARDANSSSGSSASSPAASTSTSTSVGVDDADSEAQGDADRPASDAEGDAKGDSKSDAEGDAKGDSTSDADAA